METPSNGNHKYTHGYQESVLRSHRARTAENSAGYLLKHLSADMHLLDVGSGAGTITCDLAQHVRTVTALERSTEAIRLTRAEAERRGVNLEYAVGDVHQLPFPDHSFDVVHAHQVLQHVADPVQALKEMRRVTKPGGLVAARDSDYGAFTWHPADPELTAWLELYMEVARANGGEPNAGRMLLNWALQAGFTKVEPDAHVWCFATADARSYWGGMWADRILTSDIARQAASRGVRDAELRAISTAFTQRASRPEGWFMVPHGQILCRA